MMAAPYNHELDERIARAREAEHTAIGFYLAHASDENEQAIINAYNDVNAAVDYRTTYYERLRELEARDR